MMIGLFPKITGSLEDSDAMGRHGDAWQSSFSLFSETSNSAFLFVFLSYRFPICLEETREGFAGALDRER